MLRIDKTNSAVFGGAKSACFDYFDCRFVSEVQLFIRASLVDTNID
jgi:hypothetical protein